MGIVGGELRYREHTQLCAQQEVYVPASGQIAQSALRFTGNIAVCYLLAYGIAKPAVRAILTGATQQVQENITMLAGMILFTGFNYLGQRYFVFGEKNEEKTSNRPQV